MAKIQLSYLLVLCWLLSCVDHSAGIVKLSSPAGKLEATFTSHTGGELRFTLSSLGDTIVALSPLGITIDSLDLGRDITIEAPVLGEINRTYPTGGNGRKGHNYCHTMTLPLKHRSGITFYLESRAYDDGFAYRYVIPGKGVRKVLDERSSWVIPKGAKVWFMERGSHYKLKSYAGEWVQASIDQLDTISQQGPVQGKPLVIELPNEKGILVITEAALYDYSGMRLEAIGDRVLKANFTEGRTGFTVRDTITTPWRVTMMASSLDELVNNDLVARLNPDPSPGLFQRADYIQPGKSVWRWWHKNTGTPAQERTYIDYADQLNFEYITIDEGWEDWPGKWDTLAALVSYGRAKEVGVFVWKHSKQLNDTSNHWYQMRTWLDSVKNTGAVGIKVDFMNSEAKVWIDFETRFLIEAAKRQLMVNFHGCHPSTGESHSYPNEITREGIRGLELNRMGEGPIPAYHNAALPFTRFLVGHGDYTPLGFTSPGPTTWAHQLATLIAFTSPLQVIAEDPAFLLSSQSLAPVLPLLASIPTTWDKTHVLKGSKIGELAVFARKSGETWYVAILNGGENQTYELEFSFLKKGNYVATCITDDLQAAPIHLEGLNPTAELKEYTYGIPFQLTGRVLDKNTKIQVQLAAGGGFVGLLKPQTERVQ